MQCVMIGNGKRDSPSVEKRAKVLCENPNIVLGCLEPNKEARWESRKQHTLDYLKHAPYSVRLVSCADKLHNLRTIKRDLSEIGEKVWDKFKRGRDEQQGYLLYRAGRKSWAFLTV